jgi:hypothetical protein
MTGGAGGLPDPRSISVTGGTIIRHHLLLRAVGRFKTTALGLIFFLA